MVNPSDAANPFLPLSSSPAKLAKKLSECARGAAESRREVGGLQCKHKTKSGCERVGRGGKRGTNERQNASSFLPLVLLISPFFGFSPLLRLPIWTAGCDGKICIRMVLFASPSRRCTSSSPPGGRRRHRGRKRSVSRGKLARRCSLAICREKV